jgi:uncharacterized RDD family membrane protein YckC
MAWYYAQGAERLGPLTEEQFQQAINSGAVNSATLVWREGMPQWQPFGQVSGGAGAAVEGGVCSQCRRSFPTDELLTYEGHVICAECKPTFLQRTREGAFAPPIMRYAGFWIRFVGAFLDGILLGVIQIILTFAFIGSFFFTPNPEAALIGRFLLLTLLQHAINLSYETIMVGRYGATLGKMALGLRVVRADGGRVSYGLALGRHLAKNIGTFVTLIGTLCALSGYTSVSLSATIIGGLIMLVGYVMAGFDSQKRALHDRICGTRVIWK